jgi:hypothetical protein
VIPERFRAKMAAFSGSSMDRGHLTPAMNHKSSQLHMDETFCLANISPQVRCVEAAASHATVVPESKIMLQSALRCIQTTLLPLIVQTIGH